MRLSPILRLFSSLELTRRAENGIAGACGLLSLDTDLVVGLPLEYYDSMTGTVSPFCGTYISITNLDSSTNATVVARVADASQVKGALALSVATYRALDGDATDLRASIPQKQNIES